MHGLAEALALQGDFGRAEVGMERYNERWEVVLILEHVGDIFWDHFLKGGLKPLVIFFGSFFGSNPWDHYFLNSKRKMKIWMYHVRRCGRF